MKKIAFFCIPAHGHTNPMLPVAAELVRRGDAVRFYSFDEFEAKIKATGAEFVSCTRFLPEMTKEEEEAVKNISTTEMTIQDIKITIQMNDFLEEEFKTFQPDVIYTDSFCFWGKLNAWKHNVPMVVSTSTFAFNQMSSKYMKQSAAELGDMIFGLPKISKALKEMEPYGYHIKNAMMLVQSDNKTDSVVYTSRNFQPYSECFSDHYAFVGPSVFSKVLPNKKKERPLVYISMGTVINERPDFYNKCIEALKDMNVDVIISCGNSLDQKLLGELPPNVQVYPYVDQLDVLSRADAFITHCGMNSVSESLYMAAPMVLYAQTSEQNAVARKTKEIGAGVLLADDSAAGIKAAVQEILDHDSYVKAAKACCDDFRSCSGTAGAADFIENAPHTEECFDMMEELKKVNQRFHPIYWAIFAAIIVCFGVFVTWQYAWIFGVAGGVLSYLISQVVQKLAYNRMAKKVRESYQKK